MLKKKGSENEIDIHSNAACLDDGGSSGRIDTGKLNDQSLQFTDDMNTSNPRAEQIFAAALQLFISAELRISTLLSTGRGHALLLWLVLASAASCLTGCATRFSHWEESGHVPDDVKV